MYLPRTKDYSKQNARMRWDLPDRVFFACGACHILAYAFFERYGGEGKRALWLKPKAGFFGNHIFIATDHWAFDYHGYHGLEQFLGHTYKRAHQRWQGWQASIVELPWRVLVSEPLSRGYEGLWLREPTQFLHDAMPRARDFLNRFPASP